MIGHRSIQKRKSLENLDEGGVYCAELIGAAYKELGILNENLQAYRLIPGEFS